MDRLATLPRYLNNSFMKPEENAVLLFTNTLYRLKDLESFKKLMKKGIIREAGDNTYIVEIGNKKRILLDGIEYHVKNDKIGHMLLLGRGDYKSIFEKDWSAIDLVKYANDKDMLVVIAHPLNEKWGGIDRKGLEKLISEYEKGKLSFGVELNASLVDYYFFLEKSDFQYIYNLSEKGIPIVAGQDAHDGDLSPNAINYLSFSEGILSNASKIIDELREGIYERRHRFIFHLDPPQRTLRWSIFERLKVDDGRRQLRDFFFRRN